jgi:hypothetical protein
MSLADSNSEVSVNFTSRRSIRCVTLVSVNFSTYVCETLRPFSFSLIPQLNQLPAPDIVSSTPSNVLVMCRSRYSYNRLIYLVFEPLDQNLQII